MPSWKYVGISYPLHGLRESKDLLAKLEDGSRYRREIDSRQVAEGLGFVRCQCCRAADARAVPGSLSESTV